VVPCRCRVLNVMSGALAREYRDAHLGTERTDGMGRAVLRCPDTGIEWVQEVSATGYGQDIAVLRRLDR
jgi:hypothetical protein